MREALRAVLVALYLALAPSEHETLEAHMNARPVAVLPVGDPTPALIGRR